MKDATTQVHCPLGSNRSIPALVIEVVSTNWRDDYLTKLAEYESIVVQEYWIFDYAALGGMRYIDHPKNPRCPFTRWTPR